MSHLFIQAILALSTGILVDTVASSAFGENVENRFNKHWRDWLSETKEQNTSLLDMFATLPDGLFTLCIMVVMAYIAYFSVAMMIKTTPIIVLKDDGNNYRKLISPDHMFQHSVLPPDIQALYMGSGKTPITAHSEAPALVHKIQLGETEENITSKSVLHL